MIQLFKDGDHMAIKTDAKDERDFIDGMSGLLQSMIEDGMFMDLADPSHDDVVPLKDYLEKNNKYIANDWSFQFSYWLPQIVDICCKYRGYKNQVEEKRLLIAGGIGLSGASPIATDQASSPHFPTKVKLPIDEIDAEEAL